MRKKTLHIFVTIMLLSFFSCKRNNENKPANFATYFCDAEKTTKTGNLSGNNNCEFTASKFQSNEHSRSGKYSIKSDSISKYVFSFTLPKYKPGQHYKVSIWRYGGNENGILVVQGEKNLYNKASASIEKDSAGWEKLQLSFFVPSDYRKQKIKIYAWNKGKEPIFFDDLKIEQIPQSITYDFKGKELKIYIEEPEFLKLKKNRQEAINKGILETTDESWVKAMIFYGDSSFKAKIRLKGDWLDHLKGNKWSFRIELKKGGMWKGMKTFSIQTPAARHFIDEWLIHKMILKEGLLTTRYGFVPVTLNGKSIGYYSYEEHFEKQLVESKKRREGPILKFNENTFWEIIKQNIKNKVWANYPIYEASEIEPFKQGKTMRSDVLSKEFLIAQNLLYQYKNQLIKTSEIFDIKKLAKYHAFVSLGKIYHSMRWHNQRFYYDPVLSKCEIIAYDCFVEQGPMDWVKRPIFGNFTKNELEKTKPESRINYYNFSDTSFVINYIKYLEKISDTSYLNPIFKEYKKEIEFYQNEIRKEFPGYSFNKKYYYENAEKIRKNLPAYKQKVNSGLYENFDFNSFSKKIYHEKYFPDLAQEYVHVFLEKKEINKSIIKIINFNPQDIIILGHKITRNTEDFNRNIAIGSYNSKSNEKTIEIPDEKAERVYFKIKGHSKIYQKDISPWNSPYAYVPRIEILKKFPLKQSNSLYSISGDNIYFKKGKHKLSETLIIPENYNVYFPAGTEIDITNNASFLSYSTIYIKGTENNKVIFTSSDKTAKGILIMQARHTSKINYAVFEGLNTFIYKAWGVSGAVTFYESAVEISNTLFANNSCEDMLNVVRSNFNVTKCKFKNTFADAFDSDFCTGELSFTDFNNLGNDAIDFSGSQIYIHDCNIYNPADKGVSGGEGSNLKIENCYIEGANIAIAAKDNTKLFLKNCKIENSNYGLAAFQKKPEYGPGFIKCNNLNAIKIKTFKLIEKNSTLIINEDTIKGEEKNIAKKFY